MTLRLAILRARRRARLRVLLQRNKRSMSDMLTRYKKHNDQLERKQFDESAVDDDP